MSQYSWTCNLNPTELTVGEKLQLNCQGNSEGVHFEKLEIKRSDLKDETPPLSILEIQKSENGAHLLIVTGYRPGDYDASSIALIDGANSIELQGFQWKVNSVLSKTEKPEPFGSFSVWEMSYPVWFWVALVIVFLCCLIVPYVAYKKIEKRKKDFESLRDLETVFEPIDQVYRDMMKLEKNVNKENLKKSIQAVSQIWLHFLSRQLQVPFHIWKMTASLKELKRKNFRIYRDKAVAIKKIEFEMSAIQKTDVTVDDFKNLTEKLQKLAEELQAYQKIKGGG